MINFNNFGLIEGRLTKDVLIFDNSDGSKTALVTIAAKNNIPDKNGTDYTQYVGLRGYIAPDKTEKGLGMYDCIHKGDLVRIAYTVNSRRYEKAGKMTYDQLLVIKEIEFKEPKYITEARIAKRNEEMEEAL